MNLLYATVLFHLSAFGKADQTAGLVGSVADAAAEKSAATGAAQLASSYGIGEQTFLDEYIRITGIPYVSWITDVILTVNNFRD